MQLLPLDGRPNRGQSLSARGVPTPVRGWNARDAITDMDARDAIRLVNMVVRRDGVHVRKGRQVIKDGLGGPIDALLNHNAKIFAAVNGSLIDVDGVVPTVLGVSGKAWSQDILPNIAGAFLVATNEVDGPRLFDGVAWRVMALTGVDTAKLIMLTVHQNRIFFAEKGTLKLWYLPVHALGGDANYEADVDLKVWPILLGPLCKKGGEITSIVSMTSDGGRNTNDRLVVVTSEGELVIYAGTDPAKQESWGLAGIWDVPKPTAGHQSLSSTGGTVSLITAGGVVSVPNALGKPDGDKFGDSFTDRIDPALEKAVAGGGDTGAWQVVEGQTDELYVINVPGNGATRQFVRSGQTKSWSEFTNLGATTWAERDGDLYFGTTDGKVCKYAGHSDEGQPISSMCIHAYSQFGGGRLARFTRARPKLYGPVDMKPRMQVIVDYEIPKNDYPAAKVARESKIWDDLTSWSSWQWEIAKKRKWPWRGISGRGHSAALVFSMKSTADIIYNGSDIQFEAGKAI